MLNFLVKKAVRKTRAPGKNPREDATLVQGICTPAENDTTSEPQGRNALSGAPVIASMSGFDSSKQPGWNRGIQTCIPPLTSQGEGFFLFPKTVGRGHAPADAPIPLYKCGYDRNVGFCIVSSKGSCPT